MLTQPRLDAFCNFFFFSSRRRHTRFDCDWSSDVCSSDLHRWRASAASASPEQTVGAPQRCHCPCATAKSASRDCRQTWYGSRLWVCSGTRKESSRPSPFLVQYPEDRTQPRRCYRAIDTHSRQSEDPGPTARPPHRPRRRTARVLVTRGPGSSRTSRHGLSPVGLWSRAAPSARLDDRRGSRQIGRAEEHTSELQ